MLMHTLALDISGQFHEGKGTTGWCLMRKSKQTNGKADYTVLSTGILEATKFKTAEDYYNAHTKMIDHTKIFNKNFDVVVEDFILYGAKANALTNSHMETSQLLGIIKLHCYNANIPCSAQTAVQVKTRWANRILEHKGFELPRSEHEKDALRHAIHHLTWRKPDAKTTL